MNADEPVTVERPFEPADTRKKGLRSPGETVRLARAETEAAVAAGKTPGAVVHSEGHLTKNAARSAVKRIHSGQFSAWKEHHGQIHAYVVDYDDDTFAVAVTWLENPKE